MRHPLRILVSTYFWSYKVRGWSLHTVSPLSTEGRAAHKTGCLMHQLEKYQPHRREGCGYLGDSAKAVCRVRWHLHQPIISSCFPVMSQGNECSHHPPGTHWRWVNEQMKCGQETRGGSGGSRMGGGCPQDTGGTPRHVEACPHCLLQESSLFCFTVKMKHVCVLA